MTDAPAQSKILPNSFQTPNYFVDELMRLLTGNEQKCLSVVCRKTFGWQKRSDRISKSQIVDLAGLSDAAVDECMAALVRYGVVVRVRENVNNLGVEWAPQTDDSRIDLDGLNVRLTERRGINAQRAAKARAKKSQGGDVGQPQDVAQPQGGDVGQPPQKPLSKDNDDDNSARVFKAYEANIGVIVPNIADAIEAWLSVDKVPADWIVEAIDLAAQYNSRNWKYIEAILKRWQTNGKDAPKPKGETHGKSVSNRGGRPVEQAAPTDADREAAELVRQRKQGSRV